MQRREFLQKAGNVTLLTVAAFNFGCSITPALEARSGKTALIYGSRYGATKDTAIWVAEGIGQEVDVLDVEAIDFDDTLKQYETFVLGSGVYIDGAHHKLMELLKAYPDAMEKKIVATFIVCGTTGEDEAGLVRIEGYFKKFHAPLKNRPQINENFGGRMIIDRLTDKDHLLLENFYKNVLHRPFVSWDRTQPERAKSFGLKLSSEKKV